ncbi:VOC family protein [Blautia producta]|uniref:VOC domain-containing protein n=1 Tax=Blautia producta TaxID=33035 RepID=A0A4P6M011_9FIRM|nr:VOC family protein [Blautia producta]QBE97395.1 hypothetical protein PMF13cell1_02951 [Blautia producta]
MKDTIKNYINGIQHIGIPTNKMDTTIDFYEKLGFEIAFETVNNGDRVVFLKLNNLVIETYEAESPKEEYGAIDHIALDVTDIEQVYEEIEKLGLNTLNDSMNFLPFWEHGVRFFTIEGPNKERVEFSQML